MVVAFFLVLKSDVQHYLHACSLAVDIHRVMPGTPVFQLTDHKTPEVIGAEAIRGVSSAPLGEQRLLYYLSLHEVYGKQEVLFIDTDTAVVNNVAGVFDDPSFDIAVCDRQWSHLPQGERMMHTMPFNTGVVFSRSGAFWADVLQVWRAFPEHQRADWMSEQAAFYEVVRTGRYRVKILPGMHYNYPPSHATDRPPYAAIVHYKGNRKRWLSDHARTNIAASSS